MPPTEIRAAELADLPALADVFRRSSLSNLADRANLLAHPEVLQLSEVAVREGRTRVAVVEGRIVGFATTQDTDHGFELEDLFVDPDWMGGGMGRRLVADAIAIASAGGFRRIDVSANDHALGFYERVGFVVDGEAETRFGPTPHMHRDLTVGPSAEPAAD